MLIYILEQGGPLKGRALSTVNYFPFTGLGLGLEILFKEKLCQMICSYNEEA